MLTKTTILALRAVAHLSQQQDGACWSPRRIAEQLEESPTYMAKALRHLVKAGILRAEKGVKGGVRLGQRPEEITLLALVEACQGAIIGDFCVSNAPESSFCCFHRAALELYDAIRGVLSRWSVADLLEKTHSHNGDDGEPCIMARGLDLPGMPLAGPAPVQLR
jgi:Rrf2 family protein